MKVSIISRLRDRLSSHPETDEGYVALETIPSSTVAFVEAGLKAARHSKPAQRDKIISDISEVIGCAPEDLRFVLGQEEPAIDEAEIFDFPDADRKRQVLLNNLDVAAE